MMLQQNEHIFILMMKKSTFSVAACGFKRLANSFIIFQQNSDLGQRRQKNEFYEKKCLLDVFLLHRNYAKMRYNFSALEKC